MATDAPKRRGRRPTALAAFLFVALNAAAATCFSYPTSIIFAPNGDVKAAGDLSMFAYAGLELAPEVQAESIWIGFQVGVVGSYRYGHSRFAFGGVELGFDALLSDQAGTPQAYVKPMFNLKVGLLTEYHDSPSEADGWVPHLAVGVQDVAPYKFSRSLNLVYWSGTEPITIGQVYLGRVTLGMGGVANRFSEANADVFSETWPFPPGSHLVLLAGYESPSAGPFSFALDHVGGTSEISSTNAAVSLTPLQGATITIGVALANEVPGSRVWSIGGFFCLSFNFNVIRTFRPAAPT